MAKETLDRRQMLCQGCAWAVAGLAGGCVVGGVGGGPNGGGVVDGVTDGDDDDFDDPWDTGTMSTGIDEACAVTPQPGAAGWSELSFAAFPELQDVGGWVQTQVGGRTLNVAHVDQDCFVAMETSCTHEGQRVDYRPERRQFVCTRHGAVFVPSGEPIAGPTPIALATYPAAVSGNSVWVRTG